MMGREKREGWLGRLLLAALASVVFVVSAGNPRLMAQASSSTPSASEMPAWQIAAGKKLAFEVATIKPNRSDASPEVNFTLGFGDRYADTGGRFLTKNISLLDYIRFAYKLTDGQVEILQASAPKWIAMERFDIQAKSDLPDPTKNQMRLMTQALLADRFKLHVHMETREMPVLALVLIKPGTLGPQLDPHPDADDACPNIPPANGDTRNGVTPDLPEVCGGLASVGVPGAASRVRLGGRRVPLELLAAHLGEMGGLSRPVVDQTGLSGTFDFVLEWGADSAAEPRDENNRETYLQESLKDQLGLKLERRKAALAVLLVDSVNQQPADN